MSRRRHALVMLLPLLALAVSPSAGAQTATGSATPARTTKLDPAARAAIVTRSSTELRSKYIYPVVGEKGAAAITAAATSGAYDRIVDLPAFATRLTDDLRGVMTDKHLMVFDTTSRPAESVASLPEGEAGIVRADRLPGGIGYLEIFGFANPWAFKPALDRAMAGLKGSRILILDMRGNGGGDPASVSYLVSYLVPAGQRIGISSIVWRKAGTTNLTRKSFFSEPTPVSFAGVPAYVLTSGNTFFGRRGTRLRPADTEARHSGRRGDWWRREPWGACFDRARCHGVYSCWSCGEPRYRIELGRTWRAARSQGPRRRCARDYAAPPRSSARCCYDRSSFPRLGLHAPDRAASGRGGDAAPPSGRPCRARA